MARIQLHRGRVLARGIVAATNHQHCAHSHGTEDTAMAIAAMKEHHGARLVAVPKTRNASGVLRYGDTRTVKGGTNAIVLYVRHGAGLLSTGSHRVVDLDVGDWAYIPAGVDFAMTGQVISGMNLQFDTEEVVSV